MSYPGSKAQAGVFQRIIGQMPQHPVYVEPFFVSDFHVPQTVLGGIGVGAMGPPHCQSPAWLLGSMVVSVMYSAGAIGRPEGSVVAQPNCGLDTNSYQCNNPAPPSANRRKALASQATP